MKIAVLILGRYSGLSRDKIYDNNVRILSSSKHDITFVPSCWNIDLLEHDYKKYNPIVAIYPPKPPQYNCYKLLVEKGLRSIKTNRESAKAEQLINADKQKTLGRVFQHLHFWQIYEQIRTDYDYVLRIRWDSIIKESFNLDDYIDQIQKENDKLVLGFATKRKYWLDSLYSGLSESDMMADRNCLTLSLGVQRHLQKVEFFTTEKYGVNADYYSTLWDIGILFNTKIQIYNPQDLYNEHKLLPAEWGWYQIFKENKMENVSHEMIHERVIFFDRWKDLYESY